jgi:heat-inducible transcriptional repressor
MQPTASQLPELRPRQRDILHAVIREHIASARPVASAALVEKYGMDVSTATVRSELASLEELGLLTHPHTSAGRVPTEAGLRLFVNGLLEIGALSESERGSIEAMCAAQNRSLPDVLGEASAMLSGLSSCAGLVLAPKTDRPLRHIEFVGLGPGRALVVLVTEEGLVENRVVDVPIGVPLTSLTMAANYLNARLSGRTLGEARTQIQAEIERHRTELDELTQKVVETGLATWAEMQGAGGYLIVRGQAKLLDDVTAVSDIERIRGLFEALEARETTVRLLDATGKAEGVQIFIGAENSLFNHAGCSLIVAPYQNSKEQIVGAIGVIGPTRINYARIIPMVDYTAKVIGRLLG